jgi:hypothetical protein
MCVYLGVNICVYFKHILSSITIALAKEVIDHLYNYTVRKLWLSFNCLSVIYAFSLQSHPQWEVFIVCCFSLDCYTVSI